MKIWLASAALMQLLILVLAIVSHRYSTFDRVVALEFASALETMALLMLAEGLDRDVYFDAAVIFALMSFVGNLVYVRALERWI
jgi:multisubunit Na+/H+ antiporter MnhF subunit